MGVQPMDQQSERRFFEEGVYRLFEANLDRLEGRSRPPTIAEEECLVKALGEIAAARFDSANRELVKVQSLIGQRLVEGDWQAHDPFVTTRQLREKLRKMRVRQAQASPT